MRDSSITERVVALARPGDRSQSARALAAALGADDFVLLVRDPDLAVLLPAPGFPQTLRAGPAWMQFVDRCREPGRHGGEVDLPAGSMRAALALALDKVVAVLIGGTPRQEAVLELECLLPLVSGLVRAEVDAASAAAAAEEAHRAASRAQALARALEAARAEGARLNARLSEEHRRKDEFLAMLSHELRNPLSPLVSSIDLLRSHALQPQQAAQQLEIMARQIRQLTRLVDDLLDVSRVSLGRIALRRQPLVLREVLISAIEATRPLIDARRHTLEVTVTDEALPLNADSVRLTQVFANLLHNAAKYTDPGGKLALSVQRQGTDAVVSVSDNGVGLSPEFQPRVFDLFAQAPVSIGGARDGLGIGLTLVRALVELHGGSVTADSQGPGRGSTFVVRLPITSVAESPAPPATPGGLSKTATPLRLLIVDDNVDAADSLAAMLRAMGHDAEVAYSGARALQVAADLEADLIFLDLSLPEMDGFEILRRLRRVLRRPTRFIALTGYSGEEMRRRCVDAGFDEHAVKPVLLDQLESIMQRAAPRDTAARSAPAAA